jgi:hypothetical protein
MSFTVPLPPPAHSFIIGPAVINTTHAHSFVLGTPVINNNNLQTLATASLEGALWQDLSKDGVYDADKKNEDKHRDCQRYRV